MTNRVHSRFLVPLAAVTVASFAVVVQQADAEVCNPRTYYRNSTATAETCQESYDDAVWSAVAALEASYNSCEFLSVSVVGPVSQYWLGAGTPIIYDPPQCVTTLRIQYTCQVCYAS